MSTEHHFLKDNELKKHLEVELAKIEDKDEKDKKEKIVETDKEKNIITEDDLLNDMQLKSGVDVLKVLTITNGIH